MHDAELVRTTKDRRKVSELSADEIRGISLDATGFMGDFSCSRVPAFEEVLALAKGRINIDVDTKTSRSDLVAIAIRDAGMLDQAFVSTDSADKLVLARETVPEVRLQARPDTLEEYDALVARLDRPPEIIEVPIEKIEAFTEIARAAGSKVFVDVFFEDIVAYGEGDTSGYKEAYERGADVLQTEFPTFVLESIGRLYWSAWPEHRRLEIGESPLLR
jgi:glycerophosphoryl diester phosphodiesterase